MKQKNDQVPHQAPSCDIPQPAPKSAAGRRGVIRRHRGDFTWTGVRTERYKTTGKGWAAISRNVLSGIFGEKTKFHVRYFEIEPGGYSSLESHRHEHVVICIRGKGRIVMGGRPRGLGHLDVAYIAPDQVHQLRNPYGEPFGFLCIVDAKRDRPRLMQPPGKQDRLTPAPKKRRTE